MRFSCDRCGKRYATADEPVPGRVYKLPCRRCGHAIVVRVPSAVVAPLAAPPLPPGNPGSFEPELEEPARPARTPPPVPALGGTTHRPLEKAPASAGAPSVPEAETGGLPPYGPAPAAQGAAPPADDLAEPPPGGPGHEAPQVELSEASAPSTLLPDEPGAVAPEPAPPPEAVAPEEEPPRSRRSFELSRMARARPDLPLPLLLVGLLIVAAIVAAVLFRPERHEPRPQPPAAAPAGAPGAPPAPGR